MEIIINNNDIIVDTFVSEICIPELIKKLDNMFPNKEWFNYSINRAWLYSSNSSALWVTDPSRLNHYEIIK